MPISPTPNKAVAIIADNIELMNKRGIVNNMVNSDARINTFLKSPTFLVITTHKGTESKPDTMNPNNK